MLVAVLVLGGLAVREFIDSPQRDANLVRNARETEPAELATQSNTPPRFFDFQNLFLKWDDLGPQSMQLLKQTSAEDPTFGRKTTLGPIPVWSATHRTTLSGLSIRIGG